MRGAGPLFRRTGELLERVRGSLHGTSRPYAPQFQFQVPFPFPAHCRCLSSYLGGSRLEQISAWKSMKDAYLPSCKTGQRDENVATRGAQTQGSRDKTTDTGGSKNSINNQEWRQWIARRLKEMEDKGVLKRSDLDKRSEEPTTARPAAKKSQLSQAILEELKKLPPPDPNTGFAELGEMDNYYEDDGEPLEEDEEEEAGVEDESDSESAAAAVPQQKDEERDRRDEDISSGRINQNRLFFPGQTYDLSELDPSTGPPPFRRVNRQKSDSDIHENNPLWMRNLHFLNQDLLARYLTEQGKIQPRRKTGLKKKTQRKLVRTIKLARQMAILPINSREREEDDQEELDDY